MTYVRIYCEQQRKRDMRWRYRWRYSPPPGLCYAQLLDEGWHCCCCGVKVKVVIP